ncbi:hypothetical protein ACIQMJ_36015 [Actinosynnema sp. NPDC091369]
MFNHVHQESAMPSPASSSADRIALFRLKAADLLANPLVQSGMTIQYRLDEQQDGTFAQSGTRVTPEELSRLMIDVRPFEKRNDAQVSLEGIDTVVMRQLKAQGFNHLAAAWAEKRKEQKEARNRWYRPSAPKQDDEFYPCDLVELEYYGNTYHLDPDKVSTYQELIGAGAGLLIHQTILNHLLRVANEVRQLLHHLDELEQAGVKWDVT